MDVSSDRPPGSKSRRSRGYEKMASEARSRRGHVADPFRWAIRLHAGRFSATVTKLHDQSKHLGEKRFVSLQALRSSCLVCLCVGLALLISSPGPSEVSSALKAPNDRKTAPDFTLKDERGAEVKLSSHRGKVVLLNFWATWCGPCKMEIPWFVEFESKYTGAGFTVLGVSMDEDSWKSVRPYVKKERINYPVMIGNEALAGNFGDVESLPQTLLIDREGRIAAKHVGLTSKSDFEKEIAELLRK